MVDQSKKETEGISRLHFHIPKDDHWGLINNSRENYDFKFDSVFDQECTQDEVFDVVAKGVLDSTLAGYNGTIFAYGQTGSGKTFTITGGAASYNDRGLIPRCLQYIFHHVKNYSSNKEFAISVSYLEVYNENGYDLLYQERESKKLEDLPRVTLHEDNDSVMVRNLSEHIASTEEEALNLLFLGDTNKIIAETPSNPASSRSHCIFTINITCRDKGSSKVLRSKLNLVDLAGSERVSKTKIDGTILKEARYINLSLHFLEQVIIALHERSIGLRTHIPYRNSMMTSLLRDSLGGNCKTSMIATIAVEKSLLFESISTCRFAQRVALIQNDAQVNEELDLNLVVENLRKEVESLRAELALAKADYDPSPLPEYEKNRVRKQVEEYIYGDRNELLFGDIRKIKEAFEHLKQLVLTNKQAQPSLVEIKEEPVEISTLKSQLSQRDAEIAVLVSMLQEGNKPDIGVDESAYERLIEKGITPDHGNTPEFQEEMKKEIPNPLKINITKDDKMELLKEFQREYDGMPKLLANRKAIKEKQERAKALSVELKAIKKSLNAIKANFEQKQIEKIMLIADSANKTKSAELALLDYDINKSKSDLETVRNDYKQKADLLAELKRECDHLQHLTNSEKIKMMNSFNQWISNVKYSGYEVYVDEEVKSIDDYLPKPVKQRESRPSSRMKRSKHAIEIEETISKLNDLELQKDVMNFFNKARK